MDCTQFYVCVNVNEPSDHPVACQPPTGIFDPVLGECVTGDTCVATCAPHSCRLRCNGSLDVIPDTTNCNRYYICDAAFDAVGPYECPSENPFFNGEVCVDKEWQCCQTECTPFCHSGDVQIIDPTDCNKYYICLEEGPPLEENHFTCPPGETFQPSSSICVPDATCLILCNGTISTSTTTTSTTTTDCLSSMTCPYKGKFAMCHSCDQRYFECESYGESGIPSSCDDGFLFNTDPSYPYCVLGVECPYTPPV